MGEQASSMPQVELNCCRLVYKFMFINSSTVRASGTHGRAKRKTRKTKSLLLRRRLFGPAFLAAHQGLLTCDVKPPPALALRPCSGGAEVHVLAPSSRRARGTCPCGGEPGGSAMEPRKAFNKPPPALALPLFGGGRGSKGSLRATGTIGCPCIGGRPSLPVAVQRET